MRAVRLRFHTVILSTGCDKNVIAPLSTRTRYRFGMFSTRPVMVLLAVALLWAACGSEAADDTPPATDEGCADVIDGTAAFSGQGEFSISATVASADTGWDKYADGWDVIDESGEILGTRVLAHPHETEQPFTRSLGAIAIPDDVITITLRAHDSVAGYCGDTFELTLDRS